MKPTLLLLLVFSVGCGAHKVAEKDTTCAVIHEPKSGCPAGFQKEKEPRFTEPDGKKEYACISHDPAKDECTDMLKPGESMDFVIELEIAPPNPPVKKL